MSTRQDVQAVIDGILAGKILETFDRYYADDVVMSENGANERVGKAVNRAYEENFVNGVTFHAAKVGAVIVEGDHSAVEWTLEFAPKGAGRLVQRQAAIATWKNGKIVRETFYHG